MHFGSRRDTGPGAADKAASLMRCKSSAVNCSVRTASLFDAHEGNNMCSARMKTPQPLCGTEKGGKGTARTSSRPNALNGSKTLGAKNRVVVTAVVGAIRVASKPGGLNVRND